MKGVGMLVVSLRGINFGFWPHLGSPGQNAIIFSREGLVQGYTRKIYIVCVLTWSLLGVKTSLGPAQIGLLQGFNSKFPTSIRPLSYAKSPPPAPGMMAQWNLPGFCCTFRAFVVLYIKAVAVSSFVRPGCLTRKTINSLFGVISLKNRR